jgi:hypothetical protein
MFSGQWPNFYVNKVGLLSGLARTPGYPLFLAAIFLFSSRLLSVVIVQNFLTLASALFLLWAVYKTRGRMVIGAALAMVAHVTQPLLSGLDFTILTESLFTSLLLFSLGFLLLAFQTRRARDLFMFSVLGGFAILVRPSGMPPRTKFV